MYDQRTPMMMIITTILEISWWSFVCVLTTQRTRDKQRRWTIWATTWNQQDCGSRNEWYEIWCLHQLLMSILWSRNVSLPHSPSSVFLVPTTGVFETVKETAASVFVGEKQDVWRGGHISWRCWEGDRRGVVGGEWSLQTAAGMCMLHSNAKPLVLTKKKSWSTGGTWSGSSSSSW